MKNLNYVKRILEKREVGWASLSATIAGIAAIIGGTAYTSQNVLLGGFTMSIDAAAAVCRNPLSGLVGTVVKDLVDKCPSYVNQANFGRTFVDIGVPLLAIGVVVLLLRYLAQHPGKLSELVE